MKKINLLVYLMGLLALAWSCEEKDNLEPTGNWQLSTPAIKGPAENAALVLDEDAPTQAIRFEWEAAKSSKNYQVRYTVVLDSAANADFNTPILRMPSGNGGKDLSAAPTAAQLDQALSAAGYEANTAVPLKWAVIAQSLDLETMATQQITITRFATESFPTQLFLSGTATEKGTDLSQAIAMKPLKDGSGNLSNVYEVYTGLSSAGTFKFYSAADAQAMNYGAANGQLQKNGAAIASPGAGQYRITVDLNTNTYDLLQIDKWSVVGDIITGGWGGDAPLQYKGNGVWEGSIDLVANGGFVFRANGDWAYLLKRIKTTTNQLVMESQAPAAGIAFEDIPSTGTGPHIFTLNLAADQYTYAIEQDNSVQPPTDVPATLFLLSDGAQVAELTREGNNFKSNSFLALQQGKNYTLNTASNGSGTGYTLSGQIGTSDTPDADNVTVAADFGTGTGPLAVSRDQAYQLTLNFTTGKLTWKYYNIKLFHWNEAGGGWDARNEFLMTYKHPYTYEVTSALKAGFDLKFNSPWEVQFGTSSTALAGTMTNGGDNFKGITQDGTYKATIQVSNDYASADYELVKQ